MKVYTVGQVNNYIKNLISQDYLLKNITVSGEISNLKYHSSGHIYFSLKDDTGTLPAVMFKQSRANGLKFQMTDGQAVSVTGRVDVYQRDGRYQLYAEMIELAGAGNLYEQFERLKKKLNEEGLFDPDLKKEIPKYPKQVGIVTARTGAAIQDIMNIARRRDPYVQLYLYPAKVQGEGAAETIARGIRVLDGMGLDTIIVGRGGGSMEDLWAFNEEIVVRAIAAANTPIISGVGHEVDLVLSDYAADRRAPTPSAACELAIPDIMSTVNQLRQMETSMHIGMQGRMQRTRLTLENLFMRLSSLGPENRLRNHMQTLDKLTDGMRLAMERKYVDRYHRLEMLAEKLNGLSPSAKLVGGFGYIEHQGAPLNDVAVLKKGDELAITVSTGTVKAEVI